MSDPSPFQVPSPIARDTATGSVANATAPFSAVRKLLVIADASEEARTALYYACCRARETGARIALLGVIEPADFQHWAAVQERMLEEAAADIRARLFEMAGTVNRVTGRLAEFRLQEGQLFEQIRQVITGDPSIRLVILAAAGGSKGPGPLVARLASDSQAFSIPVTVVPAGLTPDAIDCLM